MPSEKSQILGLGQYSYAPDSDTLCLQQSPSPAPIGAGAVERGTIGVIVANSYDHKEGIAHELIIGPVEGGQVKRYRVSAIAAAGRLAPNDALACRSGRYRVRVSPLPPRGQGIGPKPLGKEFERQVQLRSATSTPIFFWVTRKQSILHNIPMTFRVDANSDADGGKPIYELDSMSQVSEHRDLIEEEAKRQGVDAALVRAIMYMETTHGYYDAVAAVFDANASILPMNVRSDYWKDLGFARGQLKDPKNNIHAGVLLIKRLADRAHPRSVETIASLYNDLGTKRVTNYGARVVEIYKQKLWIPSPSMLEQVQQHVWEFERLDPADQVRVLQRIFGGLSLPPMPPRFR